MLFWRGKFMGTIDYMKQGMIFFTSTYGTWEWIYEEEPGVNKNWQIVIPD